MKRPMQRQSFTYDPKSGARLRRMIASAGFTETLAAALDDAAHEAHASKRLIISVALAQFLDVRIDDAIGAAGKRRRKRSRRRSR